MDKSYLVSVAVIIPNPNPDRPRLRIVATGEFQPGDGPEPADSFILYSYRAYENGVIVGYSLTDHDKCDIARCAVERGRLAVDTGLSTISRLGGLSTSPARAEASRENGKRGGRPRKNRPV